MTNFLIALAVVGGMWAVGAAAIIFLLRWSKRGNMHRDQQVP